MGPSSSPRDLAQPHFRRLLNSHRRRIIPVMGSYVSGTKVPDGHRFTSIQRFTSGVIDPAGGQQLGFEVIVSFDLKQEVPG